jgi:hypothetical protein
MMEDPNRELVRMWKEAVVAGFDVLGSYLCGETE